MRKELLLLVLILSSNFILGQDYCATTKNSPVKNYTSLSRMLYANSSNEETLCLNVYFHIVREDNGTGGIPAYQTSVIINELNSQFSNYNIAFNKIGQDFINNSSLNNIAFPSEIASLISTNNISGAINFYIVDNAYFNGWAEILGTNLILTDSAATTNVSSHEMGHCLNLYHTHETQFGLETADNCSYAGDLICDTPPDTGLRNPGNNTNPYWVDSNCNYTKNDGYNPDTENIMSYTSPTCLKHFTNQQGLRMRDAILNSPILQSVISCSCTATALLGKTTICSDETTTYTVPCGSVSFNASSNLQILNSTSNSITVKPINTSVNELASVSALVNGLTYVKEIWIGKPKVDVLLNPDSNYVYLELTGINSVIHKQNITYIKWEKISSTGNPVMGSAINSFENLAHGNSTNWSINAVIKVVNNSACDTTYVYKTITPPEPDPCVGYRISKTTENEFSTFSIIDPCAKTSSNNTEKVKDKDIKAAKLYDIYGIEVKTYNINSFKTNGLKKGIYIFKVTVQNETVTQKIIID
ncbi:zinc-dependent metalloprotease [Gaetbulibacter aestuarii]|uniref:Zinc-dependent metalloprotease n=1 Tax=Gaetbulibacter aestuarii TaxID=1502358 RepID=A0ABW7MZY5_9FLAO